MRKFGRSKIWVMLFLTGFFYSAVVAVEAAEDPVVIEVHYQNGVKFYKRGLYDKAVQ